MRLTFLGAAMTVTGSSYLLETNGLNMLVDCGMFQGSKIIEAFNCRPFPYNPDDIDCVLLTHSHIDHSGLLPKLVKEGFKGTIYATKATVELCSIMLPDSAHIQEFDAEIANQKSQRAGKLAAEPLYTVADAQDCLQHFAPVKYNTDLELNDGVRIRFRDAGHILGSSILEIWATEQGETNKLVFIGDLGQPDQPIIKDPSYIEDVDYLIMKSTYGNRSHDDLDNFAVGRTQIILLPSPPAPESRKNTGYARDHR